MTRNSGASIVILFGLFFRFVHALLLEQIIWFLGNAPGDGGWVPVPARDRHYGTLGIYVLCAACTPSIRIPARGAAG